MSKKFYLIALVLGLLLLTTASAGAITWGVPDGNAHPQVGLLVFDVNGAPAWRCSGTLLSPTVVLTAGHCTYGATGGRVWFDPDVRAVPENRFPRAGGNSIEFSAIHSHPEYNDAAFFLHDVGIVILSQPVNGVTYGKLPEIGLLDKLATKRGLQVQTFTPVGYGVQGILPNPNDANQADMVRYRATTHLIGVKGTFGIPAGTSVVFTNNPGKKATGGTCFGDSGGPTFWGSDTTIVAVTSFAVNSHCAGNGGGYRIDTVDDQAFIKSFLN